jgi:hypothetical protein
MTSRQRLYRVDFESRRGQTHFFIRIPQSFLLDPRKLNKFRSVNVSVRSTSHSYGDVCDEVLLTVLVDQW